MDKCRSVDSPTSLLAENEVLVFPLSFAQQRFWILDRLEPNSAVYNIPLALRLRGALDVSVLRESLSAIVRRHEVLRASFKLQDGAPVQVICQTAEVQIRFTDLSTLPADAREQEATHIALHEARMPFDLSRGPLFRPSLLKLGEADHVLLLTFHHIIFDGWSGRVFMRELLSGYAAIASGKNAAGSDLPLQYTDYVVWQREHLSDERLQKHLDYWRAKLSSAPAVMELPTDFPRPIRQSFRGAKSVITLSSGLVRSLKQLSQSEGVTLFMTLLAGFNVLLARHTGQEDIVVGSPVAGRNRVELEHLIGLFVNTLALRTDVSGNPSFRELLGRVRETTLGAYSHQDVPFERIVDELKPERDLSRNPIFQVMFALQNMPAQAPSLPGLEITSFSSGDRASSKFDLMLSAVETSEGMRLAFEYCTDLFEAATIARMADHFENLLATIVANPDQSVSSLPMLSAAESHQLLYGWNEGRGYAVDRCIHQLFEAQVKRVPGNSALVFEGQAMSYAELHARSNQLARYLRRMGVGPDVLVGLCTERSLDLVVAIVGTLKAGGAYLPLDPRYPKDRLAFMLEDAKPAVVITQHELKEIFPAVNGQVIALDTEWPEIERESAEEFASGAGPENLAYVIYTSGSTGRPKGCQITHANVVRLFAATDDWFHFNERDVWTMFHSYAFDFSVWELWGALIYGGKLVVVPYLLSRSPEEFYRLLESEGVTVLNQTPSSFWQLMQVEEQLGRAGQLALRYVIFGGEALEMKSLKPWFERHGDRSPQLVNMYGITETTVHVTYRPLSANDTAGASVIGRPILDLQVYILDRNLQPTPVGVPGEVYVGGAGVARGYLNRPELNAERFIDDVFRPGDHRRLYKSGDQARRLANGDIEYLGRIDQQVKIRGFRIELGEIESVLMQCAGVRQAVVIVREDVPGDKRLAAYIVPSGNQNIPVDPLRTHLKTSLPDYMIPNAFVVLESLPLTANGKINRLALPAPTGTAQTVRVPPRDDLEATLVEIWQRVLGLSCLGITDNFFELGGHSLLAVRLVAEIRQETGQEIPLATLFEGATIAHLANILREGQRPAHEMVVPVTTSGTRLPFFGVVVPGANPLGFVALARHLGDEQPVYRIQGPGPRVRRPYSPKEFEELAAEYIRSMKTVQPHGPYYFGGMCEGSRIAFDMARLLEADGEQVGLLAIFDTWVLENSQNRFLWKIDYLSTRLKRFWKNSPKEKWEALRQWARHRYGSSRPELLWPKAYWPGKNFVPKKYSGKITLFKVPKQPFFYVNDPLMGWGTRTTGDVEVHLFNSKHTAILREPYVQELARKLARCLHQEQRQQVDGFQERSPVLIRSVVPSASKEPLETLAVSSENEIVER